MEQIKHQHNINVNLNPALHGLLKAYLNQPRATLDETVVLKEGVTTVAAKPESYMGAIFILVAFFLLGAVMMWWVCNLWPNPIMSPATIDRIITESPAFQSYKSQAAYDRQQCKALQRSLNNAYAVEDELRERAININNWLYQQDAADGKEDGFIPGFHINDIPDEAWPLPHSTPAPMPEPPPSPPCACEDCECNDDCGCGMNKPFVVPQYIRPLRPIQQGERVFAPAA